MNEVKQSEFARMCGVSAMAVCLQVKKGSLVLTAGGRIDTDDEQNRLYLERHLKKVYAKNHKVCKKYADDFNVLAEYNAHSELGAAVYSQAGREAVAACHSIIRYIEETEREMALRQGVTAKPIDPSAVHFLQMVTDNIVQTSTLDNKYTHDAMLLTLNTEYRIPYLQALGNSKKKKELVRV